MPVTEYVDKRRLNTMKAMLRDTVDTFDILRAATPEQSDLIDGQVEAINQVLTSDDKSG